MKKISSDMTFFYKKVFPVLWCGFQAVFVLIAMTTGAPHKGGLMFLLGPKNGGREHRLAFADIVDVSGSFEDLLVRVDRARRRSSV